MTLTETQMDLDQQDDKTLIDNILKENDSESVTVLMNRHSGILHHTLHKYIPPFQDPYEKEDFMENKYSIFYEAVKSYRDDRNAEFATWLANKTKFICLAARSKDKKKPITVHEGPTVHQEIDLLTPELYIEKKDTLQNYLDLVKENFSPRAHDMFVLRYIGGQHKTGQTFEEIGKQFNVGAQAVQISHSKIINFLKKQEHEV